MKTTETIGRYVGRDLKGTPPKYKAEMLPPDPTCSVKGLMKILGHIIVVHIAVVCPCKLKNVWECVIPRVGNFTK
jgi:hypothetical protein